MFTEIQIEKAANWWADKLENCKHSGLSEAERKSGKNKGYEIGESMMMLLKNSSKVTNEQVEKFKVKLKEIIKDKEPRYLGVDYSPCNELAEALLFAGIALDYTLPIKSYMYFHEEKVEVRYGYGAPIQTL